MNSTSTLTNPAFQKQPKGLYLLFFTELWERFGFYTLQTIIILYMTKRLHFSDHDANILYAAFNALLYLTPVLGGYIADHYLGMRRSIIFGGILLLSGYLMCALPSSTTFFLGLSILICGNGFFKPNVSSIVGDLYEENDPRRDGGFTIFYMGINIGALIPPLFTGWLVDHVGWHAGFIAAALGMGLGQLTFILGKKYLGHQKLPKKNAGVANNGKLSHRQYSYLIIGTLLVIALCNLAFQFPHTTNLLICLGGGVVLAAVFYLTRHEPLEQQKKVLACLILIIISVGFWALYNQTFTSMMLFADRNMDKHILGLPIDAETTQFFNPMFIILLSPILSILWVKLNRFGLNPSTQAKFTLSLVFIGLGYFLLAYGAKYFYHDNSVSAWWLVASYGLQTVGELLISPIGLAMITVLAPKDMVSMMMGVWFFSQAISFSLSGAIANIAAVPDQLNAAVSLPIYSHAFVLYGIIASVTALISFLCIPFLTRMIANK